MTERSDDGAAPRSEILSYYESFEEFRRLAGDAGRLEFERTREIVLRFAPAPPADVLDIGGAAGVHALWLARAGYSVRLLDPVARHVEQAARWADDDRRQRLLWAVRKCEREASLLGASPHLLGVARRGS